MRIVFFDLETGGLRYSRDPIIQIGAIAADTDFNELESFEVKLQFDAHSADARALQMNSYDPGLWAKEAITPLAAAQKFSKFLNKYSDVERISKNGRPYRIAQLAGHNAVSFDGPFIKALYKKHNLFLPANFHILDTIQLALLHKIKKGNVSGSLSLENLALSYGIENEAAHDALGDVRATLKLAQKLLQ